MSSLVGSFSFLSSSRFLEARSSLREAFLRLLDSLVLSLSSPLSGLLRFLLRFSSFLSLSSVSSLVSAMSSSLLLCLDFFFFCFLGRSSVSSGSRLSLAKNERALGGGAEDKASCGGEIDRPRSIAFEWTAAFEWAAALAEGVASLLGSLLKLALRFMAMANPIVDVLWLGWIPCLLVMTVRFLTPFKLGTPGGSILWFVAPEGGRDCCLRITVRDSWHL
mmetsp:Transcript_5275/g.12569  ORF Transcript_5275/g.12569 Transcript_5275/m.12569 type:complete len:220 (-) Transcript_5275:76-735(-)